ncbi:2-oxoglutarate dehydrogenase E1 component DHKTD1 -like protein, mitochondrial, partial [Asbolus verrucosus]
PEEVLKNRCNESNFYRLVTAYRLHAHKNADINPVALTRDISILSELEPNRYCLDENDKVNFRGILTSPKDEGTVKEALEFLDRVYNKSIAVEFAHLENEEEVEWFCRRCEEVIPKEIDGATKLRIGVELLRSQNFDNFLANKFTGVKRYGGEGAESMMAFFSEFLQLVAKEDLEQLVIAMPHRGRLNLLTGMLNFPPVRMFSKLRGKSNFPKKYQVTGDVLSHFISSTDLQFGDKTLHVSLLYNPSHLEAVNPVSMGKTRAKQLESKDGDYGENARWSDKIINLQVHGDAAITGQGVNQECLALSGTPHFEIGGSIHLVVNNQLGFTTPADRGRSSRYCTDLAKMIAAPVVHVNGDFPEMVLKATKLAFEYQRKFRKEIFIDMNCYRQWGHNELDDPTFTNPSLYSIIRSRGTVPDQYAKKLIEEGVLTEAHKEEILKDHTKWLNEHLRAVDNYEPEDVYFKNQWEGFCQAEELVTTWDTGIHLDLLTYIGSKSVKYPEHFNIHPTLLKTHVKNRLAKVAEGIDIDWSTAETLALGSLLYEGYNVRISGQDVGRGTFSHRHVMLVDQQTNHIYIPLNNLHENQKGYLEIANSILSEEAVLGYEYGMSIESPKNLIIWEAQFGDFFNGAQIILDTFVTTGEAKWLWSSGLVILLPHGYDGAGPEHSSARIERFLQMTDSKEDKVDGDNVNMQVCHPSTPAQYFHLLRRQMVRNFRKPLVIITPKTLLRLSAATSNFADMAPQTSFLPVITDTTCDPAKVQTVLITSGKHYYSLCEKRESLGVTNTAIVRLESYCPFPTLQLQQEVAKFPNAKAFVWCQEEPQNMGAWAFVKSRFENLVGKKIQFCGRPTQAAPAVGIGALHEQQVNDILTKPFSVEAD